jgi:hypothetical protein
MNVWSLKRKTGSKIWPISAMFGRDCLADKLSSTFGSNLVAPIIKIDFKLSCDNEDDIWI